MWPFNKEESDVVAVLNERFAGKTERDIVQEIHDEFDAATERILVDAKTLLETNVAERAEKLAKLGFHRQPEAIAGSVLMKQRRDAEIAVGLVNTYSVKYPLFKFITEDEVERIAGKYGLIVGPASNFIGFIPDANLRDMEMVQVDEKDAPRDWYGQWYTYSKDTEFRVVAPLKDFDTTNMRIEKNVLRAIPIPDPVVLKPVMGGYLIVTKWGAEADIKELQ